MTREELREKQNEAADRCLMQLCRGMGFLLRCADLTIAAVDMDEARRDFLAVTLQLKEAKA